MRYFISRRGARHKSGFVLCLLQALISSIALDGSSAPASGPTFTVGSVLGLPGQQVVVPVQVADFSSILTLQFSLHWEATNATYVGVEQFGLPVLANGNVGSPSNGVVTVSWEDQIPPLAGQSLSDGTTLFAVRLLVVGPVGATSSLSING